jgi:membrane-associated phospholipid phosphatase
MLLTWSISYAFYIFAQSYVERPTLTGTDVFTQMIREVYATDNPYNAFPSLHTSLSTIMAAHWLRLHRPLGLVISGWVVLIVLSTLFVKQHYIPDVLLGLVIAYGASAFFMNRLVGRAA